MVDWDQVERLRAKGWDWDRIAEDPKADFHADSDVGEPGRALRALYYQRRSKQQRRPSRGENGRSSKVDEETARSRWTLARVGWILVPLLAVWFLLAVAFPSPVGTYLPAIPWIGLLLAVAGFVLAFGLLRTDDRWSIAARNSLIVGLVLGGVIAGGLGLVAVSNGCPTLPPIASGEPQGWEKSNGPAWTTNGAPVFYFLGSVACPYCSASSWAIALALQRFGTLSGTSYLHSSSTDVYPNTPEIVLASATLSNAPVALVVLESTDDTTITVPTATSCTENAYVAAYDSGGSIPFLVIGGHYVHSGTIVDPSTLAGLSPQQVQGQLTNESGPAWQSISPAAYLMEAFLLKADGNQPAAVANDPNVQNYLSQIS
jgi:hypothetical protein